MMSSMSSTANDENNIANSKNIVKLVNENSSSSTSIIPTAANNSFSINNNFQSNEKNIVNKNIVTQSNRLKIKRPKSELGLNSLTNNAAAFSFINLNDTTSSNQKQQQQQDFESPSNNNNYNINNNNNNKSNNMYHTDYTTPFSNLNLANSYLSIKKNFKLGLSNSNLSSSNSKSSPVTSNSFTLSNHVFNLNNSNAIRNHSNQNYRNYFFNRNSKSINEESADYETIKALRESVDSLNYKFDDANNNHQSSSLSFFSNSSNQFKINLNDINKEFSYYDTEFSSNNWADMQNEEFLQSLSKSVRNKQENIFEFMKTEVNYVKILTITQKIYVNVMVNECKIDIKQINQIFPDLDNLINFHQSLLAKLVDRYKTSSNKFIDSIGDILLNILNEKFEDIVEIYSKVCCTHLTAKSLYKQLSLRNKLFINFLQECRKHTILKRYQIPDCLTIITQRLTKYLTLLENMNNNSKEDKYDNELLTRSLDTLKLILTRVNDAVALNQNANEFKRLIDIIDSKSTTYYQIKTDKKLEQIKFSKQDLLNFNQNRKLLSINNVTVKCMSKNAKIYKDVTCLTMSDLIVFLQLNEKSKYVFMNDSSVIQFISGILIRPKISELTHTRSYSFSNTANFSQNSTLISQNNSNNSISSINNNNNSSFNNSTSSSNTSSSSNSPSYIVNTVTNEIIELKFPDEISRNQWLTLVHTHILPLIEEKNSTKDNTINTKSSTSTSHSNNSIETFIKTKSNSNLQHQSSVSSNTSTLSTSSSISHHSTTTNSNNIVRNYRNLRIAIDCVAPELQRAIEIQQTDLPSNNTDNNKKVNNIVQPLPIANTYRCNSNISNRSTISSGQGSFISTFSSSSKQSNDYLSDSNLNQQNNNNINSTVSSPTKTTPDINFAIMNHESNLIPQLPLDSSGDMVLSNDLANMIYSFNKLMQDSNIFHGNLMRSASSAGETITRNNQIIHVSIPKRAETFNGASSTKESQNLTSEINVDILKSRMLKNSSKMTCDKNVNNNDIISSINSQNNNNNLISSTVSNGATISRNSSDSTSSSSTNGGVHTCTNSNISADSGYHSRLCVDLNHDIDGDNCSCTFFENNNNLNNNHHHLHHSKFHKLKQLKNSSAATATNFNNNSRQTGVCSNKSSFSSSSSSSNSSTTCNTQTPQTSTTAMPRTHFESILKYILNDYVRLKNENDTLKKELDEKNNSLDILKQLANINITSELDRKDVILNYKNNEIAINNNQEEVASTNPSSQCLTSNKLSIFVKNTNEQQLPANKSANSHIITTSIINNNEIDLKLNPTSSSNSIFI